MELLLRKYKDSVDNTVEENSSVFILIWLRCLLFSKGMRAVKLCTNNIPVLNWRCRLMQTDLYNGCKTVIILLLIYSLELQIVKSSRNVTTDINMKIFTVAILHNCDTSDMRSQSEFWSGGISVTASVPALALLNWWQFSHSTFFSFPWHELNQLTWLELDLRVFGQFSPTYLGAQGYEDGIVK